MTQENRRKLLLNGGDGGAYVLAYVEHLVKPGSQAMARQMITGFTSRLPPGMDPADRLRLLYDVVTRETRYAQDFDTRQCRYTWYSALLEGQAVCEGIAQLFCKLATAAGVECRIIHGVAAERDGTGEELHAWNLVCLPDHTGRHWYHCDATWDLRENRRPPYRYFLKSDRYMKAHCHDWLPGLYPAAEGSLATPAKPFPDAAVQTACQLLRRCVEEARSGPAGPEPHRKKGVV